MSFYFYIHKIYVLLQSIIFFIIINLSLDATGILKVYLSAVGKH